jgi:RNA polymerase sigma factor (sigma-70 family)
VDVQPAASEVRHSRVVTWFRELRAPLRRFIAGRRGVVPADVDDVAQEVFLRLIRYETEELVTDPRGYLFKVAANVASEWSMRALRRLPHESEWLDQLADEADIVEELELAQRNSQIHRAIDELPDRAQEILRLRYGEGLTQEAISERLGLTPRVVKRDIASAYTRLRCSLTGTVDRHGEPENPEITSARSAP